ncbi:MAG: hypothetical protein R3F60_26705 [bacterium]
MPRGSIQVFSRLSVSPTPAFDAREDHDDGEGRRPELLLDLEQALSHLVDVGLPRLVVDSLTQLGRLEHRASHAARRARRP